MRPAKPAPMGTRILTSSSNPFVAQRDRKPECRTQAGLRRKRTARKVCVGFNVADPVRRSGSPDTSRQADPAHKCPVSTGNFESFGVKGGNAPDRQPAQDTRFTIEVPQLAQFPAQAFANRLQ